MKNLEAWQVLFSGAGIFALCAEIAEQERFDSALAERRASQAIKLLEKAKQRGLPGTRLIRADRAFVPLLRSKDFQKLLQD